MKSLPEPGPLGGVSCRQMRLAELGLTVAAVSDAPGRCRPKDLQWPLHLPADRDRPWPSCRGAARRSAACRTPVARRVLGSGRVRNWGIEDLGQAYRAAANALTCSYRSIQSMDRLAWLCRSLRTAQGPLNWINFAHLESLFRGVKRHHRRGERQPSPGNRPGDRGAASAHDQGGQSFARSILLCHYVLTLGLLVQSINDMSMKPHQWRNVDQILTEKRHLKRS